MKSQSTGFISVLILAVLISFAFPTSEVFARSSGPGYHHEQYQHRHHAPPRHHKHHYSNHRSYHHDHNDNSDFIIGVLLGVIVSGNHN